MKSRRLTSIQEPMIRETGVGKHYNNNAGKDLFYGKH